MDAVGVPAPRPPVELLGSSWPLSPTWPRGVDRAPSSGGALPAGVFARRALPSERASVWPLDGRRRATAVLATLTAA
eukprot:11198654-Lingulodinium_polyedra.AAC.1